MNKQSYESQIMNLPCDVPDTGYVHTIGENFIYQDAFRDARYAAAELAAKADATISELVGVLRELLDEGELRNPDSIRAAIDRATSTSPPRC